MLPTNIKNLSRLQFFYLDNCKNLCCLSELPPSTKELHTDSCISLVNVSSLKALSQSMKGVKKYNLFKNNIKLGGPSLDRVMEDGILTTKSVTFHNIALAKGHNYNENNVLFCLPGHTVPRQFKFRTICSSFSISIQLPPC
ncbi:unnamed protein product [Lathyrus sativus]|nr:unnamed protein product [Lathyrus sativus]